MTISYIIKAEAQKEFRSVASATGAVSLAGLSGEAKANAFMKAETKACRRATLRLIGLGWLDESETASIPGAQHVDVNAETGEIVEGQERPALRSGVDFIMTDFEELAQSMQAHHERGSYRRDRGQCLPRRNLIAWASGLRASGTYDSNDAVSSLFEGL